MTEEEALGVYEAFLRQLDATGREYEEAVERIALNASALDGSGRGYLGIDGRAVILPEVQPAPAPSEGPANYGFELLRPIIDDYNELLLTARHEARDGPNGWEWRWEPMDEEGLHRLRSFLSVAAEHPGPRSPYRLPFDHAPKRMGFDRARLMAVLESPEFTLSHLVAFARWEEDNLLEVLFRSDDPRRVSWKELRRRFALGADSRTIAKLWVEYGGKPPVQSYLQDQFARMKFMPTDLFWPLIPSSFVHLDEAISRWPFSMEQQPIKRSLDLLEILPVAPMRYLENLLELGTANDTGIRTRARRLLPRSDELDQQIAGLLRSPKPEVRANAANWLADRKARGTVDALKAALAAERQDALRAEMISALARLGADVSSHLDADKLLNEARRFASKPMPQPLQWFPSGELPLLRWQSGEAVDPAIPLYWVVLSNKLKTPKRVAWLDLWLDRLAPADASRFGRFIMEAWLAAESANLGPGTAPAVGAEAAPARTANKGVGVLALTTHMEGPDIEKLSRRYLREHPSKIAGCRAVLDALASHGSPEALSVVFAISSKFKPRSLEQYARTLVEEVASSRGWTEQQLADRSVPTAGLDTAGGLEIEDEEGRTMRITLNEDDQLVAVNPTGEAAGGNKNKRFAALAKEVRTIIGQQGARLFDQMLTQRRWERREWEDLVLGHPIRGRLARRLVWLAKDEGGEVVATGLAAGEGRLLDVDGRELSIVASVEVQLAHTSSVGELQAGQWRRRLRHIGIKQPFNQFRENLPEIEAAVLDRTEVDDRNGWTIAPSQLDRVARKLGYSKGPPEEKGTFSVYERLFPAVGLAATINFLGARIVEWDDTSVPLMRFGFARLLPQDPYHGRHVPLRDVPRALLAETWKDMHEIADAGDGFDPTWKMPLSPW